LLNINARITGGDRQGAFPTTAADKPNSARETSGLLSGTAFGRRESLRKQNATAMTFSALQNRRVPCVRSFVPDRKHGPGKGASIFLRWYTPTPGESGPGCRSSSCTSAPG